jgi:tRNA threonylcarbamoyladenosine biosynthesis protein TsaE
MEGTIVLYPTKETVNSLEMHSNSSKQTQNIGMKLGKLAAAGDVIFLVGPLGAGKTCLTQGIARGLGIHEYTASPSFVLVREYRGKLPLYHIDLYRLDKIEEVTQLGLDDYLYGNGVCVVEWADKGLSVLPQEHLLIEMQIVSPLKRKLSFVPRGSKYSDMLSKLKSVPRGARK